MSDENEFSQVFEYFPTATLILREDGGIVSANSAARSLLGLPDGAHPLNLWNFCSGGDRGNGDALGTCAGSTSWRKLTIEVRGGGHAGLRLAMMGRRLDAKGGTPHVLLVSDEADSAHFAEHRRLISRLNGELAVHQELRARLDQAVQKEQQLHRELIHRMKNNLSMLAVIVRSRKTTSDKCEVHQALADIEGRIRSIAQVHEILDRSQEIDVVDAAALLRELCKTLEESVVPPSISLHPLLEPVRLHISDATPLCLLVNELIANAVKHAFPQDGSGRIVVALRHLDETRLELLVEDDGRGMPEGAEHGTGSRIVEALAGQMRGELQHEVTGGVRWRLIFPPLDPDILAENSRVGDAA